MQTFILSNSTRKDKRYMVKNENKTTHFGSINHQNFTIHKDNSRKESYIRRHKTNQDWDDTLTAGFWSKHLLWNKPTLQSSIKDIEKNYNIKIVNKL